MPGVDQIGTNYLFLKLSKIVSPFRVDVAGLLFSLPLIYEIYPLHIFSGNFSHEREFWDEVS